MKRQLDDNSISAYLARIGFVAQPRVDKETLDELVYLHQCSVPFETIDMHHCTEPPSLDVDAVFEKLITLKRGGYCFELNSLFELLLKGIGFTSRPCLSRAVRGRDGRMPINHQGTLVELEGNTYFVDVGFGGPMAAGSLCLEDAKEQEVRGETYFTSKVDESWWALERITQSQSDLYGDEGPSRRQVELEVCVAAVEPLDFDSMNYYFARPGYLFHDVNIANLRTAQGYYGLREDILTIREGGTSRKITLETEQAFNDAVNTYFGFYPKPV